MLQSPFTLLRQFDSKLHVSLMTKEDHVRTDRDLARFFPNTPVASLHQMHGSRALRVTGPTSRVEEADAMATDVSGLLLTIRAADCQNFVVYAPAKHVVAVAHVGWRGIESGTIPSLYALLKTEWNIRPEETFVGAGPSLGFECAEFSNPKNELPSVPSSLVRGKLVDLQGAADRELDRLGVPREQRERLPDCTKCHPETYWTYRGGDREAVKEGWTNVLMALLL